MKKTLAAVLAAAMALSTATVALATDFDIIDGEYSYGDIAGDRTGIRYGKDVKLRIKELTLEDATVVDGDELSELIDDGAISVTALVTEGSSKLASKPSVTPGSWKETNGSVVKTNTYTWNKPTITIAGVKLRNGKAVTRIPINNLNQVTNVPGDTVKLITIDEFENPLNPYVDDNACLLRSLVDTAEGTTKYEGVQVKFKVTDTYGTSGTNVSFKLRITIKKNDVELGGEPYAKGDTLTSDEFKFEATYGELNQYAEDMQLTLDEVDARNVKFDASDLYDQIGADNFSISFEDTARFDAKLSASQKDVNLYYDLDEVSAVTDAYPDVDFEFITFRGNPSFVNNGTMTFNAVGGKNTQVYTYDGDALTPLDGSYNSTYSTITVKGVKKFGTFVVASEILEVEEEPEEPAEPVDSAPSVEDKNDEEGGNPNTGAC